MFSTNAVEGRPDDMIPRLPAAAGLRDLAGRVRRRVRRWWRPWSAHTADAFALAASCARSLADLQTPQQHPGRLGTGPGTGWCNWYLPRFDHAAYGGVMTILRCADFLRREARLQQRLLICGAGPLAGMRAQVAAAFPGLAEADMRCVDPATKPPAVPPADYSFCTLWTTAYVLHAVENTALKFFFIQDWEPLFYPAGSTSAQAQLAYDFGFFGIANTAPLRRLYEELHGGIATHFDPQIDPAVFHRPPARPATDPGPRRIFFYGRPATPRNGFELGASALRLLAAAPPGRIEIVSAGAAWHPRDFGLQGIVRNLGLLDYRQTAELYRSCQAGLVLMMTRHPSYLPLELMACGALVVSNANPATRWLLEDGVNCLLAPASAPAIAERLAEAVVRYDDLEPVRRRGWSGVQERYSDWDAAFRGVWRFMERAPALAAGPPAVEDLSDAR